MDTRFLRNKSLISQKNLNEVTIIGAGGVGSCLTLAAAIMGFKKIHLWDFDILEEHNLSTTMYPESFLGIPKTKAAKRLINYFGCKTEVIEHEEWTPFSPISDCLLMAPDNMEVRKLVYKAWVRNNNRKMLIDGRMGALTMEVISCDKLHDNYLSTWKPSSDIPDEECTAKHTIFTANIISGIMLSQAFNVLHNRLYHAYIWMSLAPFSSRKEGLIIPTQENNSAKKREASSSVSQSESLVTIRSTQSR